MCILSPLEQTGSHNNSKQEAMATTKKIGSTEVIQIKKLKSGQVKVTRLLDGPIIHAGMDERMLKVRAERNISTF